MEHVLSIPHAGQHHLCICSGLTINGLPVTLLIDLKPSIITHEEYTSSSSVLSNALREQRACIVDVGAEMACILSQALPDGDPLFQKMPGMSEYKFRNGDVYMNRPEKELVRVIISPESKETSLTQVHSS